MSNVARILDVAGIVKHRQLPGLGTQKLPCYSGAMLPFHCAGSERVFDEALYLWSRVRHPSTMEREAAARQNV